MSFVPFDSSINPLEDKLSDIELSKEFSFREMYFFEASILYLYKKGKSNIYLWNTIEAFYNRNGVDKETVDELFKELDKLSDEEFQSLLNDRFNCKKGSLLYNKSDEQICHLATELMEISGQERVLDFGSGDGSFLIESYNYSDNNSNHDNTYIGVEADSCFAHISMMAFELFGIKYEVKIGDYLQEELPAFDKGFTFPGFGIRLDAGTYGLNYPEVNISNSTSSVYWTYIDRMLYRMSETGKIAALLPLNALFSSSGEEYRNKIIKDGLLESVIELPPGSLNHIGTKTALVVISRDNDYVKMIDANNLYIGEKFKYGETELDLDRILDLYFSDECTKILNSDLLEFNNICPSSVLSKPSEIENGKRLSEVASVFAGTQYTVSKFKDFISDIRTERRIVTPADITDGIVRWDTLPFIQNLSKFDKYAVHIGDLIITSKSSKTKMAVVDVEPSETTIATSGMLIIRCGEELNPTFLKIFLESSDGKRVLKSIQKGSVIMSMNAKDLENITVPVPDIKFQNMASDKYNEQLSTLYALKEEARIAEEKLSVFYETEVIK